MKLADRVNKMSESETLRMAKMARELRAKGVDVISLSLGEPDFDTPFHIKKAAKKALDGGQTKYTPVAGTLELRQAIVDKLSRDNDLEYSANQIVVSNGAKQSIYNVCMSVLNPDDECIVFSPYWVSYAEIIKMADAVPVFVSAGIEQDFKVNAKQLEVAITSKTRMILFSSPCNPTGSVFDKRELTALAEVIKKHQDIVVVSDEIYEYINFSSKHQSIAAVEGMKERTVVVNGFSKGFSMTGWRLGYIAAPVEVAAACEKIQGQVTSGATSFGQAAAVTALRSGMKPTDKMKKQFKKRRNLVIKELERIPGIKTNHPEGAFYLFPDCSEYFGKKVDNYTINNADDLCDYLMMEAHVGLVSGTAFGDSNCFRLSYAASEEQLKEACSRIKNALEKLR